MDLPASSYATFDAGAYRFMIDNSMELSAETTVKVLEGLWNILNTPSENEDELLKQCIYDNIEWVVDIGIHVGLCISEINCIIIMRDGTQYKFLKFFKKNIEELITEEIAPEEESDTVYQLK
jgi:hypothetical protein